AMIDPRLQPYAAPLIKATAESHKTIGGVRYLLSYLAQGRLPYRCLNKNEPQFVGYDLYFATNKDRVAFDGAVKELGIMPYVKGALVTVPDQKFLARCEQFLQDNPQASVSFRNEIQKVLNLQETDTILHSVVSKPDKGYFEKMKLMTTGKMTTGKKYNIFFDDKWENV